MREAPNECSISRMSRSVSPVNWAKRSASERERMLK